MDRTSVPSSVPIEAQDVPEKYAHCKHINVEIYFCYILFKEDRFFLENLIENIKINCELLNSEITVKLTIKLITK